MDFFESPYWYEAYKYNQWAFEVWPQWILAGLFALSFFAAAVLGFVQKKSKTIQWAKICVGIFLLLFAFYAPFRGDFENELAFRTACYEDAGLFVYEQLQLGPEYWLEVNEDSVFSEEDSMWVFDELNLRLSSEDFNQSYEFVSTTQQRDALRGELGRQIVSRNLGNVFSEYKNFLGGPSGFLSQRARTCTNLPNFQFSELDLTSSELLRRTVDIEHLNGE